VEATARGGVWRSRAGGALHRDSAPPAPAGQLRLRQVARREFDHGAAIADRPGQRAHLREYLSDLVRPYGTPLREEALARGEGHSYGEMAAALISATVSPREPVDLVALAFSVPDVRPGRATATYLSEICPGRPFAFAVTDQGAAAAFTALRLVGEYGRGGGCRRALLLVLEQATRLYDVPEDARTPVRHAGVALLCDGSGPARVAEVRHHTRVAPERAGHRLAAELTTLAASHGAATVIAGGGLTTDAVHATEATGVAAGMRRAPADQPMTGVWSELADDLPTPALVADYDPVRGSLCLAAITP
jgi:hypothetical protein